MNITLYASRSLNGVQSAGWVQPQNILFVHGKGKGKFVPVL